MVSARISLYTEAVYPYNERIEWLLLNGNQRFSTGVVVPQGRDAEVTITLQDDVVVATIQGDGQEIIIGEGVVGRFVKAVVKIEESVYANLYPVLIKESTRRDAAGSRTALYDRKSHAIIENSGTEAAPEVGPVKEKERPRVDDPMGEKDFCPSLYGLAVSEPRRPWDIVNWDSWTMYLPEESLYVNGRTVSITVEGNTRSPNEDVVSLPQVSAGEAIFCFVVPREITGQREESVDCEFKAYIAKNAQEGDDVTFRFPVVIDGRPQLSGSVIIDGLKGYHKLAPLQLDWLDVTDSMSGETQRMYRIFTPPEGSVICNNEWLPIEETDGESWLYVQPNKNYYCHVKPFEAHIDDRPSREGGFQSFIIGGFF